MNNWSELGSYQIANYQAGTFTTLLISADGNALRVDVDGTTRISTTDNTFSSGAVGLWSYEATAANQHVFEDFNLVDLSQGRVPSFDLALRAFGVAALFDRAREWLGSLLGKVRAVFAPVTVEARSLVVEVPEGQMWKNYILVGGQRVATLSPIRTAGAVQVCASTPRRPVRRTSS